MKILVFIQVDDNKINKMSLETLTCAQNLSSDVSAITFNEQTANELTKYNLMKLCLLLFRFDQQYSFLKACI